MNKDKKNLKKRIKENYPSLHKASRDLRKSIPIKKSYKDDIFSNLDKYSDSIIDKINNLQREIDNLSLKTKVTENKLKK